MSPRSFRRYRRLGGLARRLLTRLDLIVAQTEEYAANYRALGASSEVVRVTGSVKYDGGETNRDNARTRQLRELFAVGADELVWVAGSTQAPEEQIVLDIFARAHAEHPNLRLILVPRQKDRFNEVADLLSRSGVPFVRRSELPSTRQPVNPSPRHPVIL